MNVEKPGTPASAAADDHAVNERYADETLRFVEQHGDAVDRLGPQEERKLVWKLHWRIMLLLSVTNLLLFVSCRLFFLPRPMRRSMLRERAGSAGLGSVGWLGTLLTRSIDR